MGCGTSTPANAQQEPAAVPKPKAAAPVKPSAQADDLTVPAVPGSLPANSLVIFVLGGPGSGKGTQCDRIKARYQGVVHLSAGDLLRDEVKSGSKVGAACQTLMTEGKLVPVSVTIQLLKNAMIKSGGHVFLIDGFPRALDQAQIFEQSIGLPKAVLFFDCPEDEMEKRLLERGKTSGRADDNADTIRKRFKTFVEQSLPVKDHYGHKGNAFVISAVPPPDEVFVKVSEVLDPLLSSPEAQAPSPATEDLVVPAVDGHLPADSQVIFVLGGPGCGKGTQCDRIKARYQGVVHLSAGDLLRDEVKSGSKVGAACQTLMTEGKLVPVSVTIQLLKNAMIKSGGHIFLVDGFPRALDQAQIFEQSIGLPKAVLFFDCPEDEMEKRLLERGKTSGRADDNADTIRKRFKTFVEQSLPVKDHYGHKGLAHVISAVPPPDEVFEEVKKALDAILPHATGAEAATEAVSEADLVVPAVDGVVPADSLVIFVLGGPGCGKGTQCDRIKARYQGVVHLSAGDLLRDEVKSGSKVGAACQTLMTEGKLVPVSVTIQLLKNAMIKSGGSFFLIDGFPRALDQAAVFEQSIGLPKAVLFFDCPEDEMEKRLLERGKTSGRADDNADTIRKRFKTFVEQSLPVKDHYGDKGLAHVISAVPPPDEVFEEVRKVLDPIAPLADA